MDSDQLKICYSGTLGGFTSNQANRSNILFKWFWTYNPDYIDSSTRSGYYLIKSIEILVKKYNIKPQNIKLSFWGKIHHSNQDLITELGLNDFFEISGYLPKLKSLERIQQADLLFLPLEIPKKKTYETLFIPGKLYEYLATKKPILCLSAESDCSRILKEAGTGIIVPPKTPEAIADILLNILQNRELLYSMKPNTSYIEGFSFKNLTNKLAIVFKSLETQ